MTRLSPRALTRRLSLLALGLLPLAALAQSDFPSKPVKLVVPFAAGGSTDLVARVIADGLRTTLGQAVVVDNRAGAGGLLGTEVVSQAAPDGYTIGMATASTMTVNPALYPRAEAINAKLQPLVNLVSMPSVYMVHPGMGVKDFAGFVTALKAKPNHYSAAVPGVGSLGQLMVESFNDTVGVKMANVPYRGSGPALNDALAGVVQIMPDQIPSAMPHIKSGKLLPVAVASSRRITELPDVPTFKELGYPELNDLGISWFGLVIPAKTPPAIAEKLRAAAIQAVHAPETLARLQKMGVSLTDGKSEDFPALIATQVKRNRAIVQKAGIKPE
ncbi:ABC transporter substrate-binding protein [Acidovorax carolinensis]|uniref:ABC transporter substrate-binding protein n=1 Tax=Acidovorax carolinensis TaxID=553814 RepID=A0A240UD94_9BURK|nr:tripartite tricarboxylate transporter substrate-binding protein [Acidovorax carolinensis]ART55225.1 ABC transporter substrate-binding protein [Acidovorax carolinensis]ART58990.1 ABC transporter substrate-binding protein [Acidovorax carolinensis]